MFGHRSAKILARIILSDPRLKSYSDIGRKAFGPQSGPWISAIFCLELFTVRSAQVLCACAETDPLFYSVALVTLYADSLHAVMPAYSSNTYKLLGLVMCVYIYPSNSVVDF